MLHYAVELHIRLVAGRYVYKNLILRERDGHGVVPCLSLFLRLCGRTPFSEERTEASAEYEFIAFYVIDIHTVFSISERFYEICTRTSPNRFLSKLMNDRALAFRVADSDVIDSKTPIFKISVKCALRI